MWSYGGFMCVHVQGVKSEPRCICFPPRDNFHRGWEGREALEDSNARNSHQHFQEGESLHGGACAWHTYPESPGGRYWEGLGPRPERAAARKSRRCWERWTISLLRKEAVSYDLNNLPRHSSKAKIDKSDLQGASTRKQGLSLANRNSWSMEQLLLLGHN